MSLPHRPAPSEPTGWLRRDGVLAVLLLLVTTAAYLPALTGGILWDDAFHLTAPGLRSVHGLIRIWTVPGATQQYYPVLHSAFWVEHRLWGDATLGYHLVNLVLHVTAAWLFAAGLRELRVPGAWLAALIFAVHPVGVESVAWISEQKNTLSLALSLGAALLYLRAARRGGALGYALATLCFAASLGAKSVTATLPFALVLVGTWREGAGGFRRHLRRLAPWMILGVAAGLFTAWMERTHVGASGPDYALTPLTRLLLAGRALAFYAGKLFWPTRLAFVYPRWELSAGVWWQYLFPLGVLAVVLGLIAGRRRYPGVLTGVLYFCGTLFPALGFISLYPFIFSYAADHFQYHACLGLIAIAGAGWAIWWQRSPGALRWIPAGAAGVVVAVLAGQTYHQCGAYHDAETLYRRTLATNPSAALAENNLGVILAASGHHAEAAAHFEAAVRLNPRYPEAQNNLAAELALTPGGISAAVEHYRAAVALRPDYAASYDNLASLLADAPGGWAEAESLFQRLIVLSPGSPKAQNDFALALGNHGGRRPEALAHYREAIRLAPAYAAAHAGLAFELAKDPADESAAAAEYRAALQLAPDDAATHNNFANLLAPLPGAAAEAEANYRSALRLSPGYAEARCNLANLLARDPGRGGEAIAEYLAALRLNPDFAEAHNNLGALYANQGRRAEAIAQFQAALRVRPDFAEARANLAQLLAPGP